MPLAVGTIKGAVFFDDAERGTDYRITLDCYEAAGSGTSCGPVVLGAPLSFESNVNLTYEATVGGTGAAAIARVDWLTRGSVSSPARATLRIDAEQLELAFAEGANQTIEVEVNTDDGVNTTRLFEVELNVED